MAITYTKSAYNIEEKVYKVLSGHFPNCYISSEYVPQSGDESIRIFLSSSDDVLTTNIFERRSFTIDLFHYYKDRDSILRTKYVANRLDRLKSLLNYYRNIDNYWYDLQIPSIEYGLEEDELQGMAISKMSVTMECHNDITATVTEQGASSLSNFITSWTTTTSPQTITLPLVDDGNAINFSVNWGDGSAESTITAYNDTDISHSYSNAGTYTMTIKGTISGWKFNDTGNKTEIRDIINWGNFNFTTEKGFMGCSNLNVSATDTPTVTATDMDFTFKGCSLLTGIGGNWNVSNVTGFVSFFDACSVFNQDISTWNTSSAVSMAYMFLNCTAFNQNIGSWNTSNVTNMTAMLRNADAFDQDISSWDVDQVSNFTNFMLLANGLSNANYNKLLHHWEADNPTDGLNVNFGGSNADTTSGGVNGETARTNLVNNHSWTITDGDS